MKASRSELIAFTTWRGLSACSNRADQSTSSTSTGESTQYPPCKGTEPPATNAHSSLCPALDRGSSGDSRRVVRAA